MIPYLSWQWQPAVGAFGILPMLVGSLLLALTATGLGTLWALGLSFWLAAGNAPRGVQKAIKASLNVVSTIPTVVIAFIAIFTLIPMIQRVSEASGYSLLASVCCLAFLILPSMLLVMHKALAQAEQQVEPLASSLGLNPVQRFLWLLVPLARSQGGTAILLGFSRALSDTMIALMLSGNSPQVPSSLLDSFRTLTAHTALVASTDSFSASYGSLYPCVLLLFAASAACHWGVGLLRKRAS